MTTKKIIFIGYFWLFLIFIFQTITTMINSQFVLVESNNSNQYLSKYEQ
jgi:hypothetical protein